MIPDEHIPAAVPSSTPGRDLERDLAGLRDRLAASEEEIASLNAELAETNKGVVALYAELDDKAEQLRQAARGEVVPFLTRLTETIYNRFRVIHREKGSPWPPATTIEQRQGACRDLAVLFIDICRVVGLAARFVSGYQEGDDDQEKRYLHAWAEVYLPGAGWRGFDPTHGLAVSDRHVAIAAAAEPQNAAPVAATYRGSNVEAELFAEVKMETSSAVTVATC